MTSYFFVTSQLLDHFIHPAQHF